MILNEMHTTYSTLLRRFRDATGLTPTEFIRITKARQSIGAQGDQVTPAGGTPRAESAPSLTGEVGLRLMGGRET